MYSIGPHSIPLLGGEGTEAVIKKWNEFSEYNWIDKDIKNFTKKLRENQTKAESDFGEIVRNRKIGTLKFRRQHPIGRYIVDFYCKELELIIELDGSIHDEKDQKVSDCFRDNDLVFEGKTILRFSNEQIFNNLQHIVVQILSIKYKKLPSPF